MHMLGKVSGRPICHQPTAPFYRSFPFFIANGLRTTNLAPESCQRTTNPQALKKTLVAQKNI
jgi:hypothetical protein